mmetsp:Transcript_14408/g.36780  ORF Transcript_14408/g.36780 Transcript_14408/m.36780 type:complete len:238 (+) Transcript_14408:159-872(+)
MLRCREQEISLLLSACACVCACTTEKMTGSQEEGRRRRSVGGAWVGRGAMWLGVRRTGRRGGVGNAGRAPRRGWMGGRLAPACEAGRFASEEEEAGGEEGIERGASTGRVRAMLSPEEQRSTDREALSAAAAEGGGGAGQAGTRIASGLDATLEDTFVEHEEDEDEDEDEAMEKSVGTAGAGAAGNGLRASSRALLGRRVDARTGLVCEDGLGPGGSGRLPVPPVEDGSILSGRVGR